MSWGTYDANGHTPRTDLSGRVETTWDEKVIHEPHTTGGPPYTLPDVGYGEVFVTPPASNDG